MKKPQTFFSAILTKGIYILSVTMILLLWANGFAQTKQLPSYSVAGFYPVKNTGREITSMNPEFSREIEWNQLR